jgi:hypothetical protein
MAWHLVARGDDGVPHDVDPAIPLARGAAVRLAVRPDQDGYLYVLLQQEGKKPEQLFPDARTGAGQNAVTAGSECDVPASVADPKGADDAWRRITRDAGQAYLVVILTRERRAHLADELVRRGPIAFDQARDCIVDAANQRIVAVDTRVAQTAPAAATGMVKVTDASPSDRQLVDVVSLMVVEAAKPLALTWRLVKREKNGAEHDVNSANALTAGDDVRLLCHADQDGYLYVLQQDEGKPPVVLFPDARVNDGRNFVAADQEYSVPPYCSDEKAGDESCWNRIAKTPGRPSLIVVFSTERGEDMLSHFQAGPVAVDVSSGRLMDSSGGPLAKIDGRIARTEPVTAGTGFPVRVVNSDASDTHVVDIVPLVVQDVPHPLAIEWRLMRRDKTGSIADADPTATFLRNDDLRFTCTARHDGYLYVLYQEEAGKPVVIFPDPHVNNGQNFVGADQECNVPIYCPDGRGSASCWQQLTRRPGRNVLIVIFGPEKNTDLVDRITKGAPISLDALASGQLVDAASVMYGLVNPREPVKASDRGGFVVTSVDTDPNSKEQLVDAFVINVNKRSR